MVTVRASTEAAPRPVDAGTADPDGTESTRVVRGLRVARSVDAFAAAAGRGLLVAGTFLAAVAVGFAMAATTLPTAAGLAALACLVVPALERVRVAFGLGAALAVVGSSVGWRSAIGGSSGSGGSAHRLGRGSPCTVQPTPGSSRARRAALVRHARNRWLLYPAPSVAPPVRVSQGSGRDTRTRGIDRWAVR